MITEDHEVGTQVYMVTDCYKVKKFIEQKIGVEVFATKDDNSKFEGFGVHSGSVTVYDLLKSEHDAIRSFITKNNLWSN